ncbi:MAG: SDR family NAD(P)-dependent oxidoreductase [Parvularculales bacterium]
MAPRKSGVLEGKTILVTGAARGIGRACAMLAAAEGARVVVNDLGGGVAGGDEGSAGPAQEVVDEIGKAGGEAVANSDSVTVRSGVEHMIEQAMDVSGGLHGIINPAGILRDAMFHKMSEEDWEAVLTVHLEGSFNVTHCAVNHFRKQEEGRFVLFTSTSGLIGNIGQANYAAAKMGIVGLSRIIAMEGALKNVHSNVIAPFAWTRMIATIPVKDEASQQRVERMKNAMRPEQVASCAVALVAPDCSVNGQIFAVRGNEVFLFSQPRPVQSVARLEGWQPESLLNHGFPAMTANMADLGNTASVFTTEPV